MANSTQTVILAVPRGGLALAAIRVVISWVASCSSVSLERLDDMQLALETLLAGEDSPDGEITLEVSAGNGCMEVILGGLRNAPLRVNLEAGEEYHPPAAWPLDVRLFLGALVDQYGVVGGEGEQFSVFMQKRV